MRRFACVGVLVGTLIGHTSAEAELRLNPFASDERVAELPPPLVTEPANGSAPKPSMPMLKVPQLSMPTMSMPTMKLPELNLNPMSGKGNAAGEGPKFAMPKLPDLRPQGEIFDQLERGRKKLWNTAKAPFQKKPSQNRFLPSVRPVSFQTPNLSLPKLKTPGSTEGRVPTKDPETITGWLSQPRPQ